MVRAARRDERRVLVTGLGLLTGLGETAEQTWAAMRRGESSLRALEPMRGMVFYGSPAVGVDRADGEPVVSLARRAAVDAWRDAGFPDAPPGTLSARTAVSIGTSKGGISSYTRFLEGRGEPDRDSAAFQAGWPSSAASDVAAWLDARGPCGVPVAACATGLVAVWQASAWIRRGLADVAIAGAADAGLEPVLLGSFASMRVLARVEGDPRAAIKPWDRARSGFLVGEGAGMLVLERATHARARGARIYAEVAGGAIGGDAYHLTDLDPNPGGLARLIAAALDAARTRPTEVDHVNLHGTATRMNDPLECRAIKRALGLRAQAVACAANKPQIGHLLGAAGAAELAIACLALRDQFVPPTLNLADPDPACDLDVTPLVGRARDIRACLKLSLGFGGHLAALVLKSWEG